MEQGKKRLATLVGCNYFNTRNELQGCINDVESMRNLLIGRFGFEPDHIEVLTDEPGAPVMPTGANIRLTLQRMIERAETGDVLFFHYSGHGTLIPAAKAHGQRRKKDEAIVPCDFNLITDVDFRQLIDHLPSGASFTMISDSCHSGGLIDKEKEQIGPSSPISNTENVPRHHRPKIIPFEQILQHVSSLSTVDSEHIGDHLLNLFGDDTSPKFSNKTLLLGNVGPDDGILLSGCQTNETSADMSPEEEGEKAYGAFSNAIQLVLKEEKGRISNRELVIRTRELVHKKGFSQHPCLYCSDENADGPFLWQQEE